MIKGRDFVLIGIQPWDISIGSNCKNIAVELSKHNRVLYANHPLDRYTKIRKKNTREVQKRLNVIRREADGLEQINENLWTLYPSRIIESINKIRSSLIYKYLNKRNNKIFSAEIVKAIDALDFKDIILFNDNSIFLGFYAVELLKPSLSIYYIRDYLIMQPYFKRHGVKMEPKIAAKYDIVVANSSYLANYLKPYNQHSYMIGQGCDLTNFKLAENTKTPEDLKQIDKPIVGYVGYLTGLRLDIEIIAYIASERPNYNIVLVGPEDNEFKNSNLHKMGNVHFLGSKKEEDLPSYISGFDVAINPQKVNMMTIGNYPRKIDEYLAMGKPTVATETIAMSYFGDKVYIGKDKVSFLASIDFALEQDSEELTNQRIEYALSHSWKNNVDQLYTVIQNF